MQPQTYGKMVFDFIKPVFEASTCTAFKDDFYKHDLAQLEATSVPGMSYIWHIRPTGTHLFPIGAQDLTGLLSTAFRDTAPDHCEMYQLTVCEDRCQIRELDCKTALRIGGDRLPIETIRQPALRSDLPTLVSFHKNGAVVGSASISIVHDMRDGTVRARVSASIPSASSKLVQSLVVLLIREAIQREAHTLFWRFDDRDDSFLVNEMPFSTWNASLTARRTSAAQQAG